MRRLFNLKIMFFSVCLFVLITSLPFHHVQIFIILYLFNNLSRSLVCFTTYFILLLSLIFIL